MRAARIVKRSGTRILPALVPSLSLGTRCFVTFQELFQHCDNGLQCRQVLLFRGKEPLAAACCFLLHALKLCACPGHFFIGCSNLGFDAMECPVSFLQRGFQLPNLRCQRFPLILRSSQALRYLHDAVVAHRLDSSRCATVS